MASSLFSALFGGLDSRSIDDLASRLGESRQAVSRGMESTAASLIDGVGHHSSDSGWMTQIHNLVSQAPSELNISNLTLAATGAGTVPASTTSVLDSGKRFLLHVFGGNQSLVTESIAHSSGLRSASTSALMSLAAPLLMTSLGRLVRNDGLTAGQLGRLVSNEGAGVRELVPASVEDMLEGGGRTVVNDRAAEPLAVGTVAEPRRRSPWLWILPLLILIGFFFWLIGRARTPHVAETARTNIGNLGDFVARRLPNNIDLSIPQFGVENRLLDFIQDPSKVVNANTWFNFDRLLFATDSATLRPESEEQLRNIAAILRAYPNVHMKIGGYTDNTGDAQHNLQLSQDRGDSVVAYLVPLGIAPDRLEAQGYGEQYPVADNSTEQGRAQNRRIAMQVTQK
ncbi:MAG TPA: OmpA family protein [Bryobacteraceae bacterium]